MATAHEYYLSVINKSYDEDRTFGIQCVDGFKHFCRTVLGLNLGTICNPTGLAHSIWDNFESLGLNKYFDKVPSNQMVDGDWAIWAKNSRPCPSSHIAMFRKDNGNGTGVFLGQNQIGGPGYNQINISYSGIRGALRPKIYHQNSSQTQNTSTSDQILVKGSKVKLNGIFKVDILKSPLSSNLFGCSKLTGNSYDDYYNERVKNYHWLPTSDFTECDINGNPTSDQILTGGTSYVKNDNIYIVQEIDIPTNSAKLNINGRNVWVYSTYLYEVSNN